jgi:hypothetical protein
LGDINMDRLVTASQAAVAAQVTVAAICNYVARDQLLPATGRDGRPLKDARGRRLYRLGDVLKAEAADKRTVTGQKKAA